MHSQKLTLWNTAASNAAPSAAAAEEPLAWRLHRTFGPLAGGMVLDMADLAMLGPVGIVGGLLIGAPIGYWISAVYGFSHRTRLLFALAAGLYCTMPFDPLPLATLASFLIRLQPKPFLPPSGDSSPVQSVNARVVETG